MFPFVGLKLDFFLFTAGVQCANITSLTLSIIEYDQYSIIIFSRYSQTRHKELTKFCLLRSIVDNK